jgi:signal peptidase I
MPSKRHLGLLATIALIAFWALFLRPTFLGGPATYVIVSGQSMEPTLHTGDLVFALKNSSYRSGDVIAYRIPKGDSGAGAMVIHRVIGGSAREGYITQGDNREGRDQWRPKPHDVLGTMAVSVPRVGLALAFMRTPLGIAMLAGLATFFFVAAGRGRRRGSRRAAGVTSSGSTGTNALGSSGSPTTLDPLPPAPPGSSPGSRARTVPAAKRQQTLTAGRGSRVAAARAPATYFKRARRRSRHGEA